MKPPEEHTDEELMAYFTGPGIDLERQEAEGILSAAKSRGLILDYKFDDDNNVSYVPVYPLKKLGVRIKLDDLRTTCRATIRERR